MERQYSLLSNLAFVLRQMKRFARRSFRMIWLSIPLKAAGNLILFGSGVFGFAVYLSVLRVLPVWLLLLMTACTIVSFSFSGLGDKEHRKVDGARSTSIRKMSYLQDSSADPKFGKDIRLYAMYPWIEEQFAILHRQVRSSYGRVEAKNFLSASITAGMGILMELAACLKQADLYDRIQRLPQKEDTAAARTARSRFPHARNGRSSLIMSASAIRERRSGRALYFPPPVLLPLLRHHRGV